MTIPENLKAIKNGFYIAPDNSVWHDRGHPYGFEEVSGLSEEDKNTIDNIPNVKSTADSALAASQVAQEDINDIETVKLPLKINNSEKGKAGGVTIQITRVQDLATFVRNGATSIICTEQFRGCGHTFNYTPTSNLPVDNGVVFQSADGGFWTRSYGDLGIVNLLWFMNTTTPRNNPNYDCGPAIEAACAYLTANTFKGGAIYVPPGLYFTRGFKFKSRVKMFGSIIKASYIQAMDVMGEFTQMVDLTNCYEWDISDITFFGGNKKTVSSNPDLNDLPINGFLFATDGSATNSMENAHLHKCTIQSFTGHGIYAPFSSTTYSYHVYRNRIQENTGWGIYNRSTDNEWSFNYLFANRQGGIWNTASNNRFIGGKCLFNGRDNINGAGILDQSLRSLYSHIECQENYYHGIILDGSKTITMVGMLSDMNNTARRPVGQLGGKGETNAIGYGVWMKGICEQNDIQVQITSATIDPIKKTQFSYKIENTIVSTNYVSFIESNQFQAGVNLSNSIKFLLDYYSKSEVSQSIKDNTLTTQQTTTTLNTKYPDATDKTLVLAKNVGTGMSYYKIDGQWYAQTLMLI